jgi:hypothetical protein
MAHSSGWGNGNLLLKMQAVAAKSLANWAGLICLEDRQQKE